MSTQTTQYSTITDEFARDWVARFIAAWHSHDPEQLAQLSVDDVLWEDPFIYPTGALRGRDALRGWLTSVWRSIPDLTFEVVGEPFVSFDRTRLAAEWIGRGHMTGALDPPGFAPTMGAIELRGIDIHEFRGEQLAHVETITDLGSMARQIGAMPPPGTVTERVGVQMQHLTARRLRRKH
jgi:steroid delta-isomerase-like uncharacterized protein